MPRSVELSVVIVSWNTHALLAECLASLYASPPQGKFEVWVVDNASKDDSVAMVRSRFSQVCVIENRENVGFAQANNQAIERCAGRYVLLLNPDTTVRPDALETLIQFMDAHPEAGAAGSRLLNSDGTLQPSCHPMPTLSREVWRLFHLDAIYPFATYHMHKWDDDKPRKVGVLQGASLILRDQALEEIGLLDETYFMYSEEVDICYRLQKNGWRLYWVPQSQVVHYGGQSTQQVADEMFLQLYQSKLLFFRKHYGDRAGTFYKLILLVASLARLSIVPLARIGRKPVRDRNLLLAEHYRRLLTALPSM
jgi:GT2 family glycosyltransferase